MKLTYRGIQYQPQSIELTTVPSTETGTYRGAKLSFRKIQHPPTVTGFAMLTYRGARYRSLRYSYLTSVRAEQPVSGTCLESHAIAEGIVTPAAPESTI
ncbi:MAG: DUF4278 domain-containing protein [Cyanobacteria bacterium P01_G01_bin.38]